MPGGDVVLVDTSVWIAVLRKEKPLDLESIVPLEEAATCLPIVQEVLQGIGNEREYRIVQDSLTSLPVVESPLRSEVFHEAIALYRLARRSGLTIRSGVDCLIAACAIRHHLIVLHHDRDFDAIARVSGLRVRRIGR